MTLRRLQWMADTKRRDEWDRTAHIMATIGAAAPGGRWTDPDKINPLTRKMQPEETPEQAKVRRKSKMAGYIAALRAAKRRKTGGDR